MSTTLRPHASTSSSTAVPAIVGSARFLRSHRRLLLRVTRNEIAARYAGSLFGTAWVFLAPLLVLAIYAITYSSIFRGSVPGLTDSEYVLFVYAGLAPFLMTAEALSVGVASVVSNKSVLSNTVFPIDLAPVKAVLASQATMALGVAIMVVGGLALGTLRVTALLVPLVWILHVVVLIGVTWVSSLLNVLFRDLQHILTVLIIVLLIISPIAYTTEQVPSSVKPLLLFNPLGYFIIAYQKLLILGQVPSGPYWLALVVMAFGAFFFGSWFFSRAKRVIVDYV
jgi:lipopolysaccharide transport system permease protein